MIRYVINQRSKKLTNVGDLGPLSIDRPRSQFRTIMISES